MFLSEGDCVNEKPLKQFCKRSYWARFSQSRIRFGYAACVVYSVLCSHTANASAREYFYIVKPGDTVASILRSLNLRPVYGKRGSLTQLESCEGDAGSTNRVLPGGVFQFRFELDPELRRFVTETNNGELIIAKEWRDAQSQKGKFQQLMPELYLRPNRNFELVCKPAMAQKKPPLPRVVVSAPVELPVVENALPPAPAAAAAPVHTVLYEPLPEIRMPIFGTDEWASRTEFGLELDGVFERHAVNTAFSGTAALISDLAPGARIYWREDVSKSLDVRMLAEYRGLKFVAPLGKSVLGNSTQAGAGVSLLWNFWGLSLPGLFKWRVGPDVYYGTYPLIERLGSASVREDSPQLFSLGGLLENDFSLGLPSKGMVLRTETRGWYFPGGKQSDYSVSNGYGYWVGSKLMRPVFSSMVFSAGFSYGFNLVNTSLGTHSSTEVGFNLGLGYR